MFDFVCRKTRSVTWAQIMIFSKYRNEISELKKFSDFGISNATRYALSLGEKQNINKNKRPVVVEIAKPMKLLRFLKSNYKFK